MSTSNYFRGYAATICCDMLFGFSFLFTRKAIRSVSPADLLGWRFLTAALLITLCAVGGVIKLSLKGKRLLPLIGAGLTFPGLYYFFEANGLRLLNASEASMIIASVPAVTLLFSIIFLHEKPKKQQITGIFLSIAGVLICVSAAKTGATFSLRGYLNVVLAVLSFCFFTILTRKMTDFQPAEKSFLFLWEAAILYFSLALVQNFSSGTVKEFLLLPLTNRELLKSVLYLAGACSVLCLLLCNYAISVIGPSRYTSFVGLETIVAVSSSILFLGEPVLPKQLAGGAVILLGIYLANGRIGKK